LKNSLFRSVLFHLFDFFSGAGGLCHLSGNRRNRDPRKAIVFTPGNIPTTDIYLRGRLEKRFNGAVRYVDTMLVSPETVGIEENTLVVVVRHAPLRWLRWLNRKSHQLASVALLMDDDMPMALRSPELPLQYAIKTAWRYAMTKRFLGRLCSELWLSTPELAKRYPRAAVQVWEPGSFLLKSQPKNQDVYFYHGTWAHQGEIKWLVPVVQKVQQAMPDVWFEIMGDSRVRDLFRGIPRVRVVHPMSWEDYLSYTETCNYQVGLAPCLDTVFNRGRSHNKVFEITRMGAAGIYSNGIPYAGKLIHRQTGLLCRNHPDVWAAAVIMLLQDRALRKTLFKGAQAWCDGSSQSVSIPQPAWLKV
jgi:hypothetical protein